MIRFSDYIVEFFSFLLVSIVFVFCVCFRLFSCPYREDLLMLAKNVSSDPVLETYFGAAVFAGAAIVCIGFCIGLILFAGIVPYVKSWFFNKDKQKIPD